MVMLCTSTQHAPELLGGDVQDEARAQILQQRRVRLRHVAGLGLGLGLQLQSHTAARVSLWLQPRGPRAVRGRDAN